LFFNRHTRIIHITQSILEGHPSLGNDETAVNFVSSG